MKSFIQLVYLSNAWLLSKYKTVIITFLVHIQSCLQLWDLSLSIIQVILILACLQLNFFLKSCDRLWKSLIDWLILLFKNALIKEIIFLLSIEHSFVSFVLITHFHRKFSFIRNFLWAMKPLQRLAKFLAPFESYPILNLQYFCLAFHSNQTIPSVVTLIVTISFRIHKFESHAFFLSLWLNFHKTTELFRLLS